MKKTILSEYKGKTETSYWFKVKQHGEKFYQWTSSLYTTDFGGWWKSGVELARIKNTGNGYTVKLVDGSVSDRRVKTIDLDYSQAEYLLILLLQERKERGEIKFKELK